MAHMVNNDKDEQGDSGMGNGVAVIAEIKQDVQEPADISSTETLRESLSTSKLEVSALLSSLYIFRRET